jgi:hypothetical protein
MEEFVGLDKQPVGASNDDAEGRVVEGERVPAGEVVEGESWCGADLGTDMGLINRVLPTFVFSVVIQQTGIGTFVFWDLIHLKVF